MNWAYIAGFFDGEGSIYKNGTKCPDGSISYTATLPQAESRKIILERIRDFLSSQQIDSKLYNRDKNGIPRSEKHERMFILKINKRESVKAFIWGMLPYLVAKKAITQDIWRLYSLYPSLRKFSSQTRLVQKVSADDVREMRTARLRGETHQEIANRFPRISRPQVSLILEGKNFGWVRD